MLNRIALVSMLAALAACSDTTVTPSASLRITTDRTVLSNDGTKAHLTATALDKSSKAGAGTVALTVSYGDLNGTGTTATVTLDATGTSTFTYACNVATEPRCVSGSIVIHGTWLDTTGAASIFVQAPTGGGGGGDGGSGDGGTGGTDGGVTLVPTKMTIVSQGSPYVFVSSVANPAQGLPGATTVRVSVLDQNNNPMAGTPVTFGEPAGETLLTVAPASVNTDSAGLATVTLTGGTTPGSAHVTAAAGGANVAIALTVIGQPTNIIETAAVPEPLGLKGSGIQEHGLMTFAVHDSLGTPVPGVTVNFTQGIPALVTLGRASGATDTSGFVSVDYAAGSEVGVTNLTATVALTSAAASHFVAVRGAKPSASGFFFRCSQSNLPAYTTTLGVQSTTCTVRLSDRSGNRVGVPTSVSFAAEAGSITATAVTQGFNPALPNDPNEGSATVTFSTDVGNGFSPQDVPPLPAAASQYPIPRINPEPSRTNGQLVFNPRDQLVTIIAMVRGEESFVDSNHNGQFDSGELFVDESDPYIDANDNNTYDAATEPRFCGTANCATWAAPNGTWDSDRVIWVPTWVVFTGPPVGALSGTIQPASCIDYLDNTASNPSQVTASFKVVDQYLNVGGPGTTYSADVIAPQPSLTLLPIGNGTEGDNYGAMGILHSTFDWVRLSAADPTKPCAIANGPACIEQIVFGDFDPGFRMSVYVTTANKLPAALNGAGKGCGASPSAGTHTTSFTVEVTAREGLVTTVGAASGTYAY